MGVEPYFSARDLHEAIDRGEFPSWSMYVQIMTEEEGLKYKWDIFDPTKVWPHADAPLQPVGKLVLNKNNITFHTDSE